MRGAVDELSEALTKAWTLSCCIVKKRIFIPPFTFDSLNRKSKIFVLKRRKHIPNDLPTPEFWTSEFSLQTIGK